MGGCGPGKKADVGKLGSPQSGEGESSEPRAERRKKKGGFFHGRRSVFSATNGHTKVSVEKRKVGGFREDADEGSAS